MSTRDLVHIALFAAITAALGVMPPFVIPLIGVPVTAQSMGPMLAGSILGARKGTLSIALFVLLVAAGLPLLAGGRGGLAVLAGPGGGFILGWIVSAFVIGLLCQRFWSRINIWQFGIFNLIGGVVVLYPIGILWISLVTGLGLWQAAAGVAMFLIGDGVKVVATAFIAQTVRRAYPVMVSRHG